MAKLIQDQRRNPETGKIETRFRIGELLPSGKQVTGQIGFVTEKEARRLLKIYEGRRAAGESPDAIWQRVLTQPSVGTSSDIPKPVLTMQGLWERYLLSLAASGAAEATIESAKFAWKAWGSLALLSPKDVSVAKVDEIIVGWRHLEKSDRTIQIRVLLLKRILTLAFNEEAISRVPTIRIPAVREQKPHRWLSPEDQVKLLAALDWSLASSWAIYLCLQLGLRSGEATSRRWKDVDWKAQYLRVDADGVGWQTKTRTARYLPLAPDVLVRLQEGYLQAGRDDEALICGVGQIRKALVGACKRAGVPAIHPHALRHSWASRLATGGVDRPTLMVLGGWTSGELLDEVYAHAHTDHIKEQVNRTVLSTQTVVPSVVRRKIGKR